MRFELTVVLKHVFQKLGYFATVRVEHINSTWAGVGHGVSSILIRHELGFAMVCVEVHKSVLRTPI